MATFALLNGLCAAVVASALMACGGGDEPGSNARLTLASTTFSVSSLPSDASPSAAASIDVVDGPPAGLHYSITSTANGVAAASVNPTSTRAAVLQVTFKAGAALGIAQDPLHD